MKNIPKRIFQEWIEEGKNDPFKEAVEEEDEGEEEELESMSQLSFSGNPKNFELVESESLTQAISKLGELGRRRHHSNEFLESVLEKCGKDFLNGKIERDESNETFNDTIRQLVYMVVDAISEDPTNFSLISFLRASSLYILKHHSESRFENVVRFVFQENEFGEYETKEEEEEEEEGEEGEEEQDVSKWREIVQLYSRMGLGRFVDKWVGDSPRYRFSIKEKQVMMKYLSLDDICFFFSIYYLPLDQEPEDEFSIITTGTREYFSRNEYYSKMFLKKITSSETNEKMNFLLDMVPFYPEDTSKVLLQKFQYLIPEERRYQMIDYQRRFHRVGYLSDFLGPKKIDHQKNPFLRRLQQKRSLPREKRKKYLDLLEELSQYLMVCLSSKQRLGHTQQDGGSNYFYYWDYFFSQDWDEIYINQTQQQKERIKDTNTEEDNKFVHGLDTSKYMFYPRLSDLETKIRYHEVYQHLIHNNQQLVHWFFLTITKFGSFNPATLKKLLKVMKNFNIINKGLKLSAQEGHAELVRIFLEDKRADPSTSENYPIRWASRNGHHEIVKLLLLSGNSKVDPSARKNESLRYAVENGHVEVVKLLLGSEKVQKYLNDVFFTSLVVTAAKYERYEVVDMMRKKFSRKVRVNRNVFSYFENLLAMCIISDTKNIRSLLAEEEEYKKWMKEKQKGVVWECLLYLNSEFSNIPLDPRKFYEHGYWKEILVSNLMLLDSTSADPLPSKPEEEDEGEEHEHEEEESKEEDKLLEFLTRIKMKQYYERMKEEGVEYDLLPELLEDQEILEEIVTKRFHRNVILRKIKKEFGN